MANIGQTRAKYVKQGLQKMESGQGLVSDSEKAAARANSQKQADTVLGAQQSQMNRVGMAGGATGPAFQQAAQQLGKASTDAAIKASGQERQLSDALETKRRSEFLNQAQIVKAQRQQDAKLALDAWGQQSAAAADIVGSIMPG